MKVSHLHSNLSASRRTHDLWHTAATRMVSSGVLTLPEVQVVLGHADLRTTSIYTVPRIDEVIDKMQDYYTQPAPPPPRFAPGYADEDVAIIFGVGADE